MDVTSLYTNIPQDKGINTVCKAYEAFHKNDAPIPTNSLRRLLRHTTRELLPVQWKKLSPDSYEVVSMPKIELELDELIVRQFNA